MAWISVHEQVVGGKLRRLSKEIDCSQNESLGILVKLWLWAINNSDKDGKIVGADKEDLAEIVNIGLEKGIDSNVVVNALIKTGWIDVFEGDLYLHDWSEWQKQWYKAIQTRERDAKRKRAERDSVIEEKNHCSKVKREKPAETDVKKKESKNDGYCNSFEEFWRMYPRKVGKGEAYKKYQARLKDGWSETELLEASKNYALKVEKERTEDKYIKHAKTFLSENTPFVDFIKRKKDDIAIDDSNPYADWRG